MSKGNRHYISTFSPHDLTKGSGVIELEEDEGGLLFVRSYLSGSAIKDVPQGTTPSKCYYELKGEDHPKGIDHQGCYVYIQGELQKDHEEASMRTSGRESKTEFRLNLLEHRVTILFERSAVPPLSWDKLRQNIIDLYRSIVVGISSGK
jgi:hypothetical protein